MKIKFIVNPQAGGKKKGLKYGKEIIKLTNKIGEKIETDFSFTLKRGEKNATNLARRAVSEGFDKVIAVGGDGTINEVVNGMLGSDLPLGIIPAGLGNDFARALGIPFDPGKAFKIGLGNKIMPVDLGKANDRYFANAISFGIDAQITHLAQNLRERYQFFPGEGIYIATALQKLLFCLEYPEVEIDILDSNPSEILKDKITLIVVSNSPNYGRVFKIAPQAELDDGRLDICWVQKMGRWKILNNIPRAIQGIHINFPEIKILKASSFIIRSSEKLCYQMDGEALEAEKEYQISTFPKALKVLVP